MSASGSHKEVTGVILMIKKNSHPLLHSTKFNTRLTTSQKYAIPLSVRLVGQLVLHIDTPVIPTIAMHSLKELLIDMIWDIKTDCLVVSV